MSAATKNGFRGMSIFHRLLIAFTGTSLLIIVTIGFVYYYHARKAMLQFMAEQVSFSMHDAVLHFDHSFDHSIASDLILLEATPSLNNYLTAPQHEKELVRFDIEKLFFKLATAHDNQYKSIAFFDTFGNEKIIIRDRKRIKTFSAISNYPADNEIHRGEAALFQALKQAKPGEILSQGPLQDEAGNWVLLAGVSKRDPEIAGFGGVIMVTCDLNEYFVYLSTIKTFESHPVWLFTKTGTLLLSPPELEGAFDPRPYFQKDNDSFSIMEDHTHDNRLPDSQHVHTDQYSSDFIQSHNISFGSDRRKILTLVFSVPPEAFSAFAQGTMGKGALVFLAVILLAVIISWVLAGQLSRPLISLVKASRALSQADFTVKIPETSGGEIGELAHAFNTMTTSLEEFVATRDQEIESRKRAEADLIRAKDEWEKSFHAIDDIMTVQDQNLQILRVNRAACDFFGAKPEDLVGQHCYELFRGENKPCEGCPELTTLQDKLSHAHIVEHPGLGKTFQVSSSPIIGAQGEIDYIVHVARDITEQKRQEENIFRDRNIEALGHLAGGIAHDFNNLLMAVFGNIELAMEDLGPGSEPYKWLSFAGSAIDKAKKLTGQLLTFARGGEPIKETLSLAEVIRETGDFILSGSAIRCEYEFAADLWLLDADKGQIWQVIHNLVLNGKEAMPGGGKILISAKNFVVGHTGNSFLEPGHYVEIAITDAGKGIASTHIDKVFDPYFSTKPRGSEKGTGIGLTTCYSIVRKHGGHIELTSAVGQGTTVNVYLPANPGKAVDVAADSAATAAKQGSASGKYVLLMDDEEHVLQTCTSMLRHLGHRHEIAHDGNQAITLFKNARAAGTPFDAVILDLTIPGGMGGAETITLLQAIEPGVAAVVSSGYADDPAMSNYQAYGFKAALEKPYRLAELSSALNNL